MNTMPRRTIPRKSFLRPAASAMFHATRPAYPMLLKTAAIGGAGIGLVHAGRGAIEAWGDRDDGPPISHDVHDSQGGTTVRTEDGGTAFYPSAELLQAYGDWTKALAEAASAGYNSGLDPFSPVVIDEPLSPDQSASQEKHETTVGALTNPVTILMIGAIVLGAVYLKKK